ncbi:MAG: 2-iminoacetate synthase ThiH [Deltaproteobacteria bacterium CG_4_10_14_3_um_filter_60_8]|nr:MAG: thiamine biosynthesis protein ThiH [Desulfobacterales bacterium CG2_30_60_27]PIY25014.1 MAG: 2-iminoacetate synthase ThiH [Deltaproteobacteria bacterium CG_4_10_14_3_um_filter_60_8]
MEFPPVFADLQARLAAVSAPEVERALAAHRVGIDGLIALLSPAADAMLAAMAERSAAITRQRFGSTMQLFAPIYLSNLCQNRCLYCGFSADNRIERRVLTIEQAEDEAAILHDRGFSHILLVAGEAPNRLGVDYLEALALRLRDKFAAVSMEVQPLSTGEYARLFKAGITGVAVYQETYDRGIYASLHPPGPKRDFDFRLATPARAAEAGMREVGIGALLGLADWRAEGVALALHLAGLRQHFWQTAFTVSFPRLRPAVGGFTALAPVSERDLAQLLFAMRLFDHDIGLLLSTREEARFRDGMLGLGPTRYSAGSCTAPGGYGNPALPGEQFAVGDHRSMDEVSAMIRQQGFDPVRKDWDPSFQLAVAQSRQVV